MAGKDSGIWVSLDIVLGLLPDLCRDDFKSYMKLGYGQHPVERGFFAHEKDRKVEAIYVFDRINAQIAYTQMIQVSEPPNIRLWQRFTEIYQSYFEVDRETFFTEVLQPHTNSKVKVTSTLAETLFGTKGSRLLLARTLNDLQSQGLLPRPTPKVLPEASQPMSSPPPRNRRSMGNTPENSGLADDNRDEKLSKEAVHLVSYVGKLWEMTEEQAKRGSIGLLIFEEWLLNVALEDSDLRESFFEHINSPREFALDLAKQWKAAIAPCGSIMPHVLKSRDADKGFLTNDDARTMFARFTSHVVGRQATIHRNRRMQAVNDMRKLWSSAQLFKPRSCASLIDHVTAANKYNMGCVLVHASSILANEERRKPEVTDDAKRRRSETSFERQNNALTSKNQFDQTLLSDQTVFLLTLAKEAGEISDKKWLLVFNVILFAITGEVYDIPRMKQICITGSSLGLRSRQVFWRLRKDIAEKINSAAGVKSVATDDTEIRNINAGSRALSFFDRESDKPKYEIIDVSPTARKTAIAGSEALARAFKKKDLSFHGIRGGSSDNAPNASNMVYDFFDECMKELRKEYGLEDDEPPMFVNGVVPRCVWIGSGTHILSLLANGFRKESFGQKIGMDSPSGGQLPYKWSAVLSSDQRTSARGTSVYQRLLIRFFGGPFGFWTRKITEENESRWGQSVESRKEILNFIDYPMSSLPPENATLGPNSLAAAAIFIRKRLKPDSWQIKALLQVAIWSCSPEIVFSIRVEVELAVFFQRELAWHRASPDCPFMSFYSPEFKLRLLVGRYHEVYTPFMKQMALDASVLLPKCMACLPELFDDDRERQEMILRVNRGGQALLQLYKKHCSWIYKGLGIVLQINTPSASGPVSRALAQVIGDLVFPLDNSTKEHALAAVSAHKDEDDDRFWLQLAQADIIGVRQFAQQFFLVGGDESESDALSLEWLSLCQLTNSAVDQETVRNKFDTFVPIIHRRQKLNVDPHLADTTMLEGIFSTQRRKFDPSRTNARFDDVMFFDQHVLVPLRQRGRSIGVEEHKKSKEKRESRTVVEPEARSKNHQFNESAPNWCETYAQVHGILDLVQTHFLPMFTREKMKDAPKVRDLRENDSYTSQDVKLAEEWTSTLEEGAAAYHRDVSCAELVQKGKEVKLSFQLDDKNVAASAPIFNRLCYRYYEANCSVLEM